MKAIFLTFVLALSSQAFAGGITFGQPAIGGSGCLPGTTSVTLSPDQKSLSVLFDEYLAEAGGDIGKRLVRKTCNLAIPVAIPQGFSVSIIKVDYRGFASIPHRAQGRFNVEYFFAGRRGPSFRKTFRSGYEDDFTLTNNLTATATVWSACGADVNLRINSSILARSNRSSQETLVAVDSADVKAGLVYHLKWRRCR